MLVAVRFCSSQRSLGYRRTGLLAHQLGQFRFQHSGEHRASAFEFVQRQHRCLDTCLQAVEVGLISSFWLLPLAPLSWPVLLPGEGRRRSQEVERAPRLGVVVAFPGRKHGAPCRHEAIIVDPFLRRRCRHGRRLRARTRDAIASGVPA